MGFAVATYTKLSRIIAVLAELMLWLMLLIGSPSAIATPTALNVIPTADVLNRGSGNLAVEFAGGPTSSGYTFFNELQTQVGVGHNIEVGYDQALPPSGFSFWNAKLRLCGETQRRPAVAVGLWSTTAGIREPLYLTAYKTDADARFHAGVIEDLGATRLMLGCDVWHYRALSFQADYISGAASYSSFGLVYNWSNGAYLNAAQLVGNSVQAPNMYLVIIGWTGQLF